MVPSTGGDLAGGADAHQQPAVAVDIREGVVVLTIQGRLDGEAGRTLVEAAQAAVAPEVSRLDVDLRAVASFDEDGAAALIACRQLGTGLPEGLHYRTGQGPGREALLAAYGFGGNGES
jgi:hypothetical protein